MELLCSEVGQLATCYSCSDHCLPPHRLCLMAHLACGPCANYRRRCECGQRFAAGPHLSYDWLMAAMNHRCKYRTMAAWQNRPVGGDADGSCPDRWYTVQQLRDHYRGSCSRNMFVCPMNGCGHACRIDTAVEHYESAHGPFESAEPDPLEPYAVFVVLAFNSDVTKKIFNGYFNFSVGSRSTKENPCVQVTMGNMNPADLLNYEYKFREHDSNNEIIVLSVTVKNNFSAHSTSSET